MTLYLSNRDGDGKTSEEGHYRLQTSVLAGNFLQSTSMKVIQNTPAGMSVVVSPGDFKIDLTSYSYTGWNSSNAVVSISVADPANPRITSIVAYVDLAASTSPSPPNNPGIIKLAAVNGTPTATPVAPTDVQIKAVIGSSNPYVVLADVRVNAAVTSVLTANIIDRRVLLSIAPGLVKPGSIEDNAVITQKIPDQAVTTPKIADLGVTTPKIGDHQVTSQKLELQQAWIAPTFANSWVNYDNGSTYNIAGYMKDSFGFVHLRGLIKSGTAVLAFTLPAGYRPEDRELQVTISNNGATRIDILPNGQVTMGVGYSATWTSLDGITFRAV